MNNTKNFGFGQFIPGFDFLQQLTQAGQSNSLPPFSSWIAPTVSVEEIDKRIEELKAVQFWLEQNSRALSATVQALQVQKMTLSTLKGMNVNLADFAQAFGSASAPTPAAAPSANVSNWPMDAAASTEPAAQPAAAQSATSTADAAASATEAAADAAGAAAASVNTAALQWWNALTQQFQAIASQALQDPAQLPAMAQAASMASDFTKAAVKTASDLMQQAVSQASAPVPVRAAQKASTPKAEARTRPAAVKKPAGTKTAAKKATPAADGAPAAKAAPATRTARKTSGTTAAKKPAASKSRSDKSA